MCMVEFNHLLLKLLEEAVEASELHQWEAQEPELPNSNTKLQQWQVEVGEAAEVLRLQLKKSSQHLLISTMSISKLR